MARAAAAWGIDIGQCALKALKLRQVDGQLQVEAFDVVEHSMILSQPEADRPGLIMEALRQFLSRNNVSGAQVVISVPGQSSFSRFVKLPPVEAKRVPDIVRFEAEQQIPFPINEVIWRWQTFRDPDSPDVEVGIFAMKRQDVAEMLHHFGEAKLTVDRVQMAPLALYNFMTFDGQLADGGATLLADIGADKTDLVVADKGRIWTRTIQIGGNSFTEALVRTFKLSFEKAEKLKRTAASSKYARQVFQAMRPVFADLVQEIQRSIGYYTSLHRDTRFRKLIGLGNGFRLPGLQKFIEQNLNVSVSRIDSYNRLTPSPTVNAPTLNENVLSCAVAYGLAVQGLELADVSTNLLPEQVLRKRVWSRKRPWFVAAAAVLLAALFCPVYRANVDSKTMANDATYRSAARIGKELDGRIREMRQLKGQGTREEALIKQKIKLFVHRDFWPALLRMIERSTAAVAPDRAMLAAYARQLNLDSRSRRIIRQNRNAPKPTDKVLDAAAKVLLDEEGVTAMKAQLAGDAAALKGLAKQLIKDANDAMDPAAVDGLDEAGVRVQAKRLLLARQLKRCDDFKKRPRNTRELIVVEQISATYLSSLRGGAAPGGGFGPAAAAKPTGPLQSGFKVELTGWTPVPQVRANKMLSDLRAYSLEYAKWLSSVKVHDDRVQFLPPRATAAVLATLKRDTKGPKLPDPLMPDESMMNDTLFKITWWVEVTNDGLAVQDLRVGGEYTLKAAAEMLPNFEPPPADPKDPLKSLAGIKPLAPQSTITILEARTRLTAPWYRVRAADAEGKSLGEGWLSAEAVDEKLQETQTP